MVHIWSAAAAGPYQAHVVHPPRARPRGGGYRGASGPTRTSLVLCPYIAAIRQEELNSVEIVVDAGLHMAGPFRAGRSERAGDGKSAEICNRKCA